jgi:hypothetical protein
LINSPKFPWNKSALANECHEDSRSSPHSAMTETTPSLGAIPLYISDSILRFAISYTLCSCLLVWTCIVMY